MSTPRYSVFWTQPNSDTEECAIRGDSLASIKRAARATLPTGTKVSIFHYRKDDVMLLAWEGTIRHATS
jgi:hypothetical protein